MKIEDVTPPVVTKPNNSKKKKKKNKKKKEEVDIKELVRQEKLKALRAKIRQKTYRRQLGHAAGQTKFNEEQNSLQSSQSKMLSQLQQQAKRSSARKKRAMLRNVMQSMGTTDLNKYVQESGVNMDADERRRLQSSVEASGRLKDLEAANRIEKVDLSKLNKSIDELSKEEKAKLPRRKRRGRFKNVAKSAFLDEYSERLVVLQKYKPGSMPTGQQIFFKVTPVGFPKFVADTKVVGEVKNASVSLLKMFKDGVSIIPGTKFGFYRKGDAVFKVKNVAESMRTIFFAVRPVVQWICMHENHAVDKVKLEQYLSKFGVFESSKSFGLSTYSIRGPEDGPSVPIVQVLYGGN